MATRPLAFPCVYEISGQVEIRRHDAGEGVVAPSVGVVCAPVGQCLQLLFGKWDRKATGSHAPCTSRTNPSLLPAICPLMPLRANRSRISAAVPRGGGWYSFVCSSRVILMLLYDNQASPLASAVSISSCFMSRKRKAVSSSIGRSRRRQYFSYSVLPFPRMVPYIVFPTIFTALHLFHKGFFRVVFFF